MKYDDFYFHNNHGGEASNSKLISYLVLYGTFCSVLTSSFFISNEKNSSLITKLISNSRSILVSVFLHFFDKKKYKLNGTILFGLILAVLGSILINADSLFKNMNIYEKIKKKKKAQIKTDETVKIMDENKI